MQRDFDLIRKLLIFLDEKDGPEAVEVPPIDGYSDLEIKYHLVLLHDAGLIHCEPVKSSSSDRVIYVVPFDLSWNGHEFLAKVRDDTVWKTIKSKITEKGSALAFSIISKVASSIAMNQIGA